MFKIIFLLNGMYFLFLSVVIINQMIRFIGSNHMLRSPGMTKELLVEMGGLRQSFYETLNNILINFSISLTIFWIQIFYLYADKFLGV